MEYQDYFNKPLNEMATEERSAFGKYCKEENEKFEEVNKQLDDMDSKLKSSKTRFDTEIRWFMRSAAPASVPVVSILIASWLPHLVKIRKISHSVKGKDSEEIDAEIDRLQDELNSLQISVRDGNMTAKQASQKADKIFLKIRVLGKKVRNMNKKKTHVSVKNESVKSYEELLELVLENKVLEDLRGKYNELDDDTKIIGILLGTLSLTAILRSIRKSRAGIRHEKLVDRAEQLEDEAAAVTRRYENGNITEKEAVKKLIVIAKKTEIVLGQLANSEDERLEVRERSKRQLEELKNRLKTLEETQYKK